jgi:hypothetical protein
MHVFLVHLFDLTTSSCEDCNYWPLELDNCLSVAQLVRALHWNRRVDSRCSWL